MSSQTNGCPPGRRERRKTLVVRDSLEPGELDAYRERIRVQADADKLKQAMAEMKGPLAVQDRKRQAESRFWVAQVRGMKSSRPVTFTGTPAQVVRKLRNHQKRKERKRK